MVDCACLAGIVALRHYRRPEVEVIGEEVIVVSLAPPYIETRDSTRTITTLQHPPESRAPIPLSMHHSPFCLTFALYSIPTSVNSNSTSNNRTITALDPTHLEQTLAHGTLSLALNAQREICVLQKAGGVPLLPDEIVRLVGIAVQRVKELDGVVETALKTDWAGRKVEVR